MADEDDLERRLRQLEHDHRLTRWYTGRIDRDLAEIATTQQEHTELLRGLVGTVDSIATQQQTLTGTVNTIATQQQSLAGTVNSMAAQQQDLVGTVNSMAAQLRSLTQLVGEVLTRLPDPADHQPGPAEGGSE
jgi:chromosome segregation ATPase